MSCSSLNPTSKTEPNSFFSKQISSLHLPSFVNNNLHSCPYPAQELCVIFDSCSPSPSTTEHQCIVYPFHPSCHLCSSGPMSSHQYYCNNLQLVSASMLPLLQANALCTAVLIISSGGTYCHILNSDVFSVSRCLYNKIHVPFLGIKALHDWYQLSSPTSLLCK